MKGFKGQSGFTLIELIVVIVILGILAATALPKFVNIGADARVAVMKGAEGSMRAANALIYANAAIQGTTTAAAQTTVVNGTNVTTDFGFATDVVQLAKIMDLSPATDFDAGASAVLSLRHRGAATPAACAVRYTAATLAAGVVTPPNYIEQTIGPADGNLSSQGCA